MNIEYEATFPDINKSDIRARLKQIDAQLIRPEFLQKRVVFHLPKGHEIPGGWMRVRDEGDKNTMSLKIVHGERIEDQKEICITVDDFQKAVELLKSIGCRQKAFQESKRELWILDGVEITIDEWPFLEPFVEIEGKSEQGVRAAAEKIGFDYSKALFCAVGTLYRLKYGISEEMINDKVACLEFFGKNPFIS